MIDDHKVQKLPAAARNCVYAFIDAVEGAVETDARGWFEEIGCKVDNCFTRYGEGGWVMASFTISVDPANLDADFVENHRFDKGGHKSVRDWLAALADLHRVQNGEYLDLDDGSRNCEEFEARCKERIADAVQRMKTSGA